jgi:anti-sigma-K factor RskA
VDIKEYISSGVVESYVLGLLTAQERFEFEQYCQSYPELKKAREAFEMAVEKQALQNAVSPPPDAKEKIWAAIQNPPGTSTSKIINIEAATTRKPGYGWLAAASVVLFIIAGYYAYSFYTQNKELRESNAKLEEKINRTDSLLSRVMEEKKAMTDPNVTVVSLVGNQKAVPGSANVYWDSTSSNVYLVVKNMPKLPTEKQYQLWALIDGKPLDLGLFDANEPNIILKMKNTQKADAFAISIERRGNTGGPTMEEIQMMEKTRLQ